MTSVKFIPEAIWFLVNYTDCRCCFAGS